MHSNSEFPRLLLVGLLTLCKIFYTQVIHKANRTNHPQHAHNQTHFDKCEFACSSIDSEQTCSQSVALWANKHYIYTFRHPVIPPFLGQSWCTSVCVLVVIISSQSSNGQNRGGAGNAQYSVGWAESGVFIEWDFMRFVGWSDPRLESICYEGYILKIAICLRYN